MSTTLDTPDASATSEPAATPRSQPIVFQILRPIASLQLTVVLFALAMLLVFFGTLAQVDKGIETVKAEYFHSWYVHIPAQLIAMFGWRFFEAPAPDTVWTGTFPFPGGYVIGGLMFINLLAAHIVRFKLSWRRAGIITIHVGVILLLVGELITGLAAIESRMVLQIGEKGSFLDQSGRVELAFTDTETGRTVTIPQRMLRPENRISDAELPVDVEVLEFFKNTDVKPVTGGEDIGGVVSVDGVRYRIAPASEESGAKTNQRENMPGVRVRLLRKGTDDVLSERFFSLWAYRNANNRFFMALPTSVTVDGRTYTVALRNKRIPKPYAIELLDFEHENYVGTEMAKSFASTVHLNDPETEDDREVRIWMNHPLRHRGETFYQSGTLPGERGDSGTVLQVVKNPGWLLPYVSCVVVAFGMILHFGTNLARFTSRRAA